MQVRADIYRQSIDMSLKNSAIIHSTQYMPIELYKAGKLGFQHVYYQKNNQLVVKYLGGWQKAYSITKFNLDRQSNQKGIKQFKYLYSTEDVQIKKKKRRLHSIDSQYVGLYHLNNWISNDELLCQKALTQEKSAALIYQILFMQWHKALQIVNSLQKTTQIAALQYILLGFQTIYHLLNEEDKMLADYFLGRTKYEINVKQSSDSIGIGIGGNFNFVNILQQQSKGKFNEIKSLPRKAQITKINLQYLVRFAGNFKPQISNDYIKLAFKILGNECDQQEQNIPQDKDFQKILLSLDLKLTDRINFAIKLLNNKKKKKLCQALEERLCLFPSLDNIIFYTEPMNKQKEKRIEEICRLYLDQYGDLQTIAYLSYEFGFLKPYLKQFKQALQISCEHRQLQRLEAYRQTYEKDAKQEQDYKKYFHDLGCFFDYINTSQQKIQDWRTPKENGVICQTCCKIILKADNLLICGKCKHGGHINHILKWFHEHENCPHIGCPCFCN